MKGNCTTLSRWNGTAWDLISDKVSVTGPGLSRETVEEELVIDCPDGGGNGYKKKSPGTKEIGDLTVEIIWNPVEPSGVKQVKTATAAGTVSASGNASVTVTAAGLTGSPLVLAVPVTSGNVPSTWAEQVRIALQANAAIAALFDVSGTGASIVLTANDPRANDGTLNIALATGTATGITAAPTAASTTAGVEGSDNDENHHLFEDDFHDETATFWRIEHPNEAATGVIVHGTVKEVGEPNYEANQTVKRTMTIEPTGEFYVAGNSIVDEALPSDIEAPVDHYGHH